MIISLIGMSGVGKTFWSKKLEKQGFLRYDCDLLIADCLKTHLTRTGKSPVADLASWMGQPYDFEYSRRAQLYLDCEGKILASILDKIHSVNKDRRVVIDTTGSAIYLESQILKRLRQLTKVVYLETSKAVQNEMFATFIRDPKPVIWGNKFSQLAGESRKEALTRCYPELLAYRSSKYAKLALVTVPYSFHKSKKMAVEFFLSI